MIRIVAGELGGRRISVPSGAGIRPTREMVREAWFSALGDEVVDARVVDLFAGSGALGIEALSRGARSVDFVESDRRAIRVLRENLAQLEIGDRARVLRRDVEGHLDRIPDEPPYDLALADPPYGSGWAGSLLLRFRDRPFARLLCVEHSPGSVGSSEDVVWQRTYGDSALSFVAAGLRRSEEQERTPTSEEQERTSAAEEA